MSNNSRNLSPNQSNTQSSSSLNLPLQSLSLTPLQPPSQSQPPLQQPKPKQKPPSLAPRPPLLTPQNEFIQKNPLPAITTRNDVPYPEFDEPEEKADYDMLDDISVSSHSTFKSASGASRSAESRGYNSEDMESSVTLDSDSELYSTSASESESRRKGKRKARESKRNPYSTSGSSVSSSSSFSSSASSIRSRTNYGPAFLNRPGGIGDHGRIADLGRMPNPIDHTFHDLDQPHPSPPSVSEWKTKSLMKLIPARYSMIDDPRKCIACKLHESNYLDNAVREKFLEARNWLRGTFDDSSSLEHDAAVAAKIWAAPLGPKEMLCKRWEKSPEVLKEFNHFEFPEEMWYYHYFCSPSGAPHVYDKPIQQRVFIRKHMLAQNTIYDLCFESNGEQDRAQLQIYKAWMDTEEKFQKIVNGWTKKQSGGGGRR